MTNDIQPLTPDKRARRKLEIELRAAQKARRGAYRLVVLAHDKLTEACVREMDAQDALNRLNKKVRK